MDRMSLCVYIQMDALFNNDLIGIVWFFIHLKPSRLLHQFDEPKICSGVPSGCKPRHSGVTVTLPATSIRLMPSNCRCYDRFFLHMQGNGCAPLSRTEFTLKQSKIDHKEAREKSTDMLILWDVMFTKRLSYVEIINYLNYLHTYRSRH